MTTLPHLTAPHAIRPRPAGGWPVAGRLLAVLAALAPGAVLLPAADAPARPNVLLIITDQQSAAMLGAAGNPHVRTPALDRLAASGLRFESAFCANPVCAPSRFAMLTGVLPSRIGMEHNEGVQLRVPAEITAGSLGRLFRDAGYTAAYGGKWHNPLRFAESGFELLSRDERDGLAEACAAFLRAAPDRPFLLVASFINPHDICFLPLRDYMQARRIRWPEVARMTREFAALDEALRPPAGVTRERFLADHCPPLPANFAVAPDEPEALWKAHDQAFRHFIRAEWSDDQWRLLRRAYARLTEQVDAEIGRVLAALHETGLDRNTLVVFTSDHGEMAGAHRLCHKSVPYEEAIRVPLVLSYPGVIPAGGVDRDHLVSTGLDLLPTLAEFAGIPLPAEPTGRSLRPVAEGRSVAWRDHVGIEGGSFRVLRTARYKYALFDSGRGREQLIDLERDPGEMQNLAGDPAHHAILTEFRRRMRGWVADQQDTLGAAYLVD